MINFELEKVPTEEYFSVVEQPRLRQDNSDDGSEEDDDDGYRS